MPHPRGPQGRVFVRGAERRRAVVFAARVGFSILALALLCATLPAHADKRPQQQVKPMAGPRATTLRITWLYSSPSTGSQKVDKVQIGREMVVSEKSGPWMRVFANTDIEEQHSDKDTPMVGADEATPPISGWSGSRRPSRRRRS